MAMTTKQQAKAETLYRKTVREVKRTGTLVSK